MWFWSWSWNTDRLQRVLEDLQHILGRFAGECEAAGNRTSISQFEATVLDRKKGGLSSVMAAIGGLNELPPRVTGCSCGPRVRWSVNPEELRVEPLLFHIERWLRHL